MSIIDRHADLQAVIDDAYKRGGEAMREAAWQAVFNLIDENMQHCPELKDIRASKALSVIRALPLPPRATTTEVGNGN